MRFCERYAQMTVEQRAELARALDTDAGYLWQLATRWRGKRASVAMIQKLAAADPLLTVAEMVDEFMAPAMAAPSSAIHGAAKAPA